tara:strand:- start:246 stop:413 length:168 start_codon:yes stop_codon:yes gene_type:complete
MSSNFSEEKVLKSFSYLFVKFFLGSLSIVAALRSTRRYSNHIFFIFSIAESTLPL